MRDPAGRRSTTLALAGTFCCPAVVFDGLRGLVADRSDLHALSWMTDAPAWTLADVASWVADRITGEYDRPVTMLGHSTGGAIALQVALSRPELVRGLMLVDTGPNMHRHGDVTALLHRMETEGTGEVGRGVIDRSFHTAPPAADRTRLIDYARSAPARAALEVLRSQHATDFHPHLSSLRMPVSVVHGRFDPVRHVDEARTLAAAVPDGRLHLLEAGHSPMYETPDAVAAALDELLDRAG